MLPVSLRRENITKEKAPGEIPGAIAKYYSRIFMPRSQGPAHQQLKYLSNSGTVGTFAIAAHSSLLPAM